MAGLYKEEDGTWTFVSAGCGCCANWYGENDDHTKKIVPSDIVAYKARLEEQLERVNQYLEERGL